MNKYTYALLFPMLLSGANLTQAHHSSAPHFDQSVEIVLEAKPTELKAVNPHAYLYFDVAEEGQVEKWRCELSSATQLRRFGWTEDMFLNSESITIVASPARREENVCFLKSFTLPNGTVVQRNQDISEMDIAAATQSAMPEISHEDRPDYLANGQPNLEGPWISISFGRNPEYRGDRTEFVATEAGIAAAEGYEMSYDDPILRCHYLNAINGWNHDTNVNDITQTEDKVIIQYGFMDVVRTVHLDQTEHPENIVPSDTGHSIGRWEGDTLVVDTYGFEEGVLNHFSGMKHSDQMRLIERFSYNKDEQRLYRDYSVTDPLYLVGEATGSDAQSLSSLPYTEYGCVELSGKNNVRPTDERYQQIDESGRLVD